MQIQTSNHLTKIKDNFSDLERFMPTSHLRAILGTDDIGEMLSNSIVPSDALLPPSDREIFINGARHSMNKLLESIDLSYDIFRNVIDRASKVKKSRSLGLSPGKYVELIKEIITSLIDTCYPAEKISENVILKLFYIMSVSLGRKRAEAKYESIILNSIDTNLSPKINLFKNKSIDKVLNILEITNAVLGACYFKYGEEKLYISPISIEEADNIIQKFKRCQEKRFSPSHPSPTSIKEIVKALIRSKLAIYRISGVAIFSIGQEKKKVVSLDKLVPMPIDQISRQIGEYGAADSWNSFAKTLS